MIPLSQMRRPQMGRKLAARPMGRAIHPLGLGDGKLRLLAMCMMDGVYWSPCLSQSPPDLCVFCLNDPVDIEILGARLFAPGGGSL